MRIRMLLCAAACVLLAGLGSNAQAAVVTFSLGAPTVVGSSANLDVSLTFDLEQGETGTLDTLGISVVGSDNALTDNGTNFGRFSFVPSLLIADWSTGGDIDVDGFVSFFDNAAPGLGEGTHVLGTLSVNLLGISEPTVLVRINGNISGEDTFAAGDIDEDFVEFAPPAFDPGEQTLDVASVPEPGSLTLFALGSAIWFLGLRSRKRKLER
jgi:hypothetical protein